MVKYEEIGGFHRKLNEPPTQEPLDKSGQKNNNTATRVETAENTGGSGNPACAEMIASSTDHFGTPSENLRDLEPSKGPSIVEHLRDYPDWTRLIIQQTKASNVLEYPPCKIKKTNRKMPVVP